MARTPTVDRRAWAEGALHMMADVGVADVRVEPLARRLGISKGSFYWHFKNLDELIEAALELWAELATEGVAQELATIEDPRERLSRLIEIAWHEVEQLRAEGAIAAAAVVGDPRVRPVFERVSQRRLALVRKAYRELGLSTAEARRYAETLYAAYLGTLQLVLTGGMAFTSARALKQHHAHLASVLLPPRREGRTSS